jgi:hypothetical protein
MKKKLTLVTFAAAFAAMFGMDLDMAAAQFGAGPRFGNQVAEPDSFRRVATDLNVGLPGRLWIGSNFADEGFGYTGSYLTVGGKTRLFEDFLDGRWLTEARLHHSIEDDGGFFANVGIERVFSIKAAGADVVMGAWYDFDGDQQGNFGHDFSQLGLNAAIKTRRWDLVGNGYFPIGERNFRSEGTVGGTFFQGNNILLQQGIDSALTGFDVSLRMRPKQMAFMNGTFEIGGYGYSSDLVNSFGGGRLRIGAQGKRGVILGAEINHDDRFRTTGSFNIGYVFGSVGGRNSEYAGIGRDLEETNRNDHIVRFNQAVELAIDPFTGAPYNVVHVQDGAGDGGDGTAENPFDTLADVQANSGVGDVIFVAEGGELDGGIRLQDRQFLLGGGTEQIIDIQNGRRFRLGEDTGNGAVLTNAGGSNVVILADNNIVRGVTIDGTGASNGINGNGSDGGTIESNSITGANEFGILLSRSTGDWNINDNELTGNGIDGLWVRNTLDPSAVYTVNGNNASNNGFEGLHFENFQAASVSLSDNITNNNGQNGLEITDYLTAGGSIDILQHTSDSNGETGILVVRGDGNLNIVNATVTNNIGGGITTDTFTNMTEGQMTFVGNANGGVSTIDGNGVGAGANLQFDLFEDGAQQDILVTGLTIDNGGRGIFATSSGVDTELNIDIIDMISISENLGDGIRLLADNGGTLNANIVNNNIALQMVNNAKASGANIFISASGVNGVPPSQVNTVIENVNIEMPGSTASAGGIAVSSIGNAFTTTNISDVDITKSLVANVDGFPIITGDIGVNLDFANSGRGDINVVNIDNANIVTDFGVTLDVAGNTIADVNIRESVIQAVSTVLPPEGSRASDDPFSVTGANEIFGGQGIRVRLSGDNSTAAVDSLTRLTITDVQIRDFAGPLQAFVLGDGDTRVLVPDGSDDPNFVDQGNGLGFALPGAAVDIATFGDANLLLDFRNNEILNNGAGYDQDPNNNNRFDDQPISVNENTEGLLYYDAVRINAFDDSRISTRIVNNLFQDNFERGLSLDTYQSATLIASITNNAFDGNDRGQDPDNNAPGSDVNLDDDLITDFEAVNNEEFFLRAYESPFVLDDGGDPIDINDDDLPDFEVLDDVPVGFATMCIDMSNNVFALGVVIEDLSAAPGDFRLGLDGATNGFTQNGLFSFSPPTESNFGLCEQLISNDELFFAARGFSQPDH